MRTDQHALVIGTGIIGVFTAYYLCGKQWSVTMVEKDCFGQGATHGNCGLVVPNHIFPLNDPGNLLQAFFWMFRPDAPLYIKPRVNPGLIRWLIHFVGRCHKKDIREAAEGRHALLQDAVSAYAAVVEKERLNCDWAVGGSLHAYRSEKKWSAYAAVAERLRPYGIAAQRLDRQTMLELEPALDSRLAGGWYYKDTATLRPDRLMLEMKRLLSAKGVRIVENCPVNGFVGRGDRAEGVRTKQGTIAADAFVVAAGAWTPMFARSLGSRLPIQPGKGFSLTMKPSRGCPRLPMFFEEKSVVATPWSSGFRLGGTMEFAGYDPSLNRIRLKALSRAAARYLRNFEPDPVQEPWCGFRPMTYDGMPIIGRSPRFRNVMVAAGHNMVGLSMGPGSGKLVAELLNHDAPHIDPMPYRLERFEP